MNNEAIEWSMLPYVYETNSERDSTGDSWNTYDRE
jgi:hypothetical protein